MLKADKKAEKASVMYVSTLEDINSLKYRLFDEAKLDKLLSQFWYSLKTSDGDHYRVSSMKNGAGAELDIICIIIPFSRSLKKTLMKFVPCLKLLDTDMWSHTKKSNPKVTVSINYCLQFPLQTIFYKTKHILKI